MKCPSPIVAQDAVVELAVDVKLAVAAAGQAAGPFRRHWRPDEDLRQVAAEAVAKNAVVAVAADQQLGRAQGIVGQGDQYVGSGGGVSSTASSR